MEYQAAFTLGRFTNGTYYLKGTLDEVRIEPGVRSANWVWASTLTASSNGTLANYGPISRDLPTLSVGALDSSLSLIWPATGVGYALYTTTNLLPPVTWTLATNRPLFVNSNWEIVLTNGPRETSFYRLQAN